MPGVGQNCIGSAGELDKSVTGTLEVWTKLPEATWNLPGASGNLPEHSAPGGFPVASKMQIPFICTKAGLAIAVGGKTVCDRLKMQRSKKHHQLKHLGVWVCALPSVRHCDRALQHHSSCPSSALRASWKCEGQPRTWLFDVWWWPAHVDVGI